MRTIGLTGGIASGKSTVATHLAARAIPVLDADDVYHRLLAEDATLAADLRARFGPEVFRPDGTLDRAALGSLVFADPEARRDLGRITHPRVRARIVAWLAEQRARHPPPALVVVVIPLLFEGGLETMFEAVWVVACDPATQLARLMARSGLDEASARARIASQMPLAEKLARADAVIDNQADPETTRHRIDRLLADASRPSPPDGPV